MAWALGAGGGSLGSSRGAFLGSIFVVVGSVDGDLDGNGPAANFFALESFDRLLLLLFATNVDEAVALALPGLSPTPADNTGRCDSNTSIGEQGGETSVIDVEPKVGDKEHGRGLLSHRVLPSRARGTRSLGLADAGSLLSGRRVSRGRLGRIGGRRCGSSFLLLCLRLALQREKRTQGGVETEGKESTYGGLFLLLLGLGRLVRVRSGGGLRLGGVTIRLCL
jgi:hypothetical protein